MILGTRDIGVNRAYKVPALRKFMFNSERQESRYMNKLTDEIISARDEFWKLME